MTVLAVALAGALGAAARYVVDWVVSERTGGHWPWGTLVANGTGSLLGGVIAGLVIFVGVRPGVPLVAGVGFAGSFTTFSTFAFETVRLAVDGHRRAALTNVAATLAVSLTAAGVGLVAVAVLT